MFGWLKKRRELIRKRKEEERKYIDQWDELVAQCEDKIKYQEAKVKALSEANERLIRHEERLKATEERLKVMEENLQLKIKQVEQGADPQQLFVLAVDKVWQFVWELNKNATQVIIDKIRDEDSDFERNRFEQAIADYKADMSYAKGVATPESIAKIRKSIEDKIIVADREGRREEVKKLTEDLAFMKKIGVIQ